MLVTANVPRLTNHKGHKEHEEKCIHFPLFLCVLVFLVQLFVNKFRVLVYLGKEVNNARSQA